MKEDSPRGRARESNSQIPYQSMRNARGALLRQKSTRSSAGFSRGEAEGRRASAEEWRRRASEAGGGGDLEASGGGEWPSQVAEAARRRARRRAAEVGDD